MRVYHWTSIRGSGHNPAFGRLRDAISEIKNVIEDSATGEKIEEIRDLEESIQKALSVWDIKISISVEPPDVEHVFQLGTTVALDDGMSTGVEGKGHGLQRSLIMALMRVWAAESKKEASRESNDPRERSNIFAFEEPELFLHPQVCRATYEALKEVALTDQVLLCTHSSHFVSMEDYRDLAIVRKPNQNDGTEVLKVNDDLFEGDTERKKRFDMIRYFNPDRNEVFFARKVALVEGQTEKAVIPVLARRLGVFSHDVTIADCGGKFNLTLYMKVLNAFKIPHIVIYDEDPVPEELKPGESNYQPDRYKAAKRTFEENSAIEDECKNEFATTKMIPGELEDILSVSTSHAEMVGKPYAAVEKYSDEANPVPTALEDLVRAVY